MSVLGRLLVYIGANTTELQQKLQNTERRLLRTGERVQRLGYRLTTGLTLPLAAGAAAAFKFAGDLDKSMATSTAIMSDASAQMRARMEDTARALARTSTYSASQAASAYYYLASAGLDASQSLAALPAVVDFATAGQFELSRATDLLTDAQSALGLTSKDTATNLTNLTRVSDALVAANTLANASVEQFSIALTNQAGPALRAVGKDIEEGLAALAAFADQGIKAEEAGTKLYIVLRDLQKANLNAGEVWRKHGLSVYDANGKMRSISDIIGQLEGKLTGLSDKQKRLTLSTLAFTDKSVGALLALLGYSDAIARYETNLRAAGGTTERVANRQMRNLRDELTLLKNRLVDVFISLGKGLTPAFKQLFAIVGSGIDVFASMTEFFANLPETTRKVVAQILAFTAALGPATLAIGLMIRAASSLIGVYRELGGVLKWLGRHPVIVLTTAIVAFTVASVQAAEQTARLSAAQREFGINLATGAERASVNEERITRLSKALVDVETKIRLTTDALLDFRATGGLADALDPGGASARANRRIDRLNATLTELVKQAQKLEAQIPFTRWLRDVEALGDATSIYMHKLVDIEKRFKITADEYERLGNLIAAKKQLFETWMGNPEADSRRLATLSAAIDALILKRQSLGRDRSLEELARRDEGAIDTMQSAYDRYLEGIDRGNKIFDATGDRVLSLGEVISANQGLFADLLDIPATTTDQLKQVYDSLRNFQTLQDSFEGKSVADSLFGPQYRTDLQTAEDLFRGFVDRLSRPITALGATFAGTFDTFSSSMGNALGQAAFFGASLGESMKNAAKQTGAHFIAMLARMAIEQIAYHLLVKSLLGAELATFLGVKGAEVGAESTATGIMLAERIALHIKTLAMWAIEVAIFIANAAKMIFMAIVAAFSSLGPWGYLLGLGVAAGAVAAVLAAVNAFAEGAIVTRPTLGLVGEAGPEAIIPLRRFQGITSSQPTTVILELDGRQLGKAIIPHWPGAIRQRVGI